LIFLSRPLEDHEVLPVQTHRTVELASSGNTTDKPDKKVCKYVPIHCMAAFSEFRF